MKALLLGGGKGTRLRPITDHANKHEILLGDISILEHALLNIIASGITQILITFNETYSDSNFVPSIVKKYSDLYPSLHIEYLYSKSSGIAGEILQASDFLQGSDFVLAFGDTLFENTQQFRDYLSKYKNGGFDGMMLLGKAEHPERHATPFFEGSRVVRVEEKCKDFPHDLVVTTWDILPARATDMVKDLKPSARGELEISDLRNELIKTSKIGYAEVKGWWIDAGVPYDLIKANYLFLARDFNGKSYLSSEVTSLNSVIQNSSINGNVVLKNCSVKNSILQGNVQLADMQIEDMIIFNDQSLSGTSRSKMITSHALA